MDLDGYRLYEQLKHGNPVLIQHQGTQYKLQFIGGPLGANNYLLLTSDKVWKQYGWGWGSEQVWRAIENLAAGLHTPQVPRYRPYNERADAENS